MARPNGSPTVLLHAGWQHRDMKIIKVLGLRRTNELRDGKPKQATFVLVKHIPCGATKEMSSTSLRKWQKSSRAHSMMRVRAWCKCLPQPTSNGYSREKGTHKALHRAVMEKILGRKLYEGESVHHRNGVKHDNCKRNLELRVSYHPQGQRVSDLVSHAKEILRRYAPHVLAASAAPFPKTRILSVRRLT